MKKGYFRNKNGIVEHGRQCPFSKQILMRERSSKSKLTVAVTEKGVSTCSVPVWFPWSQTGDFRSPMLLSSDLHFGLCKLTSRFFLRFCLVIPYFHYLQKHFISLGRGNFTFKVKVVDIGILNCSGIS